MAGYNCGIVGYTYLHYDVSIVYRLIFFPPVVLQCTRAHSYIYNINEYYSYGAFKNSVSVRVYEKKIIINNRLKKINNFKYIMLGTSVRRGSTLCIYISFRYFNIHHRPRYPITCPGVGVISYHTIRNSCTRCARVSTILYNTHGTRVTILM